MDNMYLVITVFEADRLNVLAKICKLLDYDLHNTRVYSNYFTELRVSIADAKEMGLI